MKKKLLTSMILLGLLTCGLTGCKKEEIPDKESAQEKAPVEEVVSAEDTTTLTCSLCEKEKNCDTYTVDNQEYIVCSDCYNEFATAFGLNDAAEIPAEIPAVEAPESVPEESQIPVCSLCEMEKDCDTYTVDDQQYIVCPDCYNEFATAFGLNETEDIPAEEVTTPTCSLCEVQKVCGEYTADGQTYIVCPDCANEFVTAFEDNADKHICSGCEQELICGKYTVDGSEYYVCLKDFEEFAYGVGLY